MKKVVLECQILRIETSFVGSLKPCNDTYYYYHRNFLDILMLPVRRRKKKRKFPLRKLLDDGRRRVNINIDNFKETYKRWYKNGKSLFIE